MPPLPCPTGWPEKSFEAATIHMVLPFVMPIYRSDLERRTAMLDLETRIRSAQNKVDTLNAIALPAEDYDCHKF